MHQQPLQNLNVVTHRLLLPDRASQEEFCFRWAFQRRDDEAIPTIIVQYKMQDGGVAGLAELLAACQYIEVDVAAKLNHRKSW
jgi:hypothetical protein